MSVDTLLLIGALICFVLDALATVVRPHTSLNLTALGLALWVLSLLI